MTSFPTCCSHLDLGLPAHHFPLTLMSKIFFGILSSFIHILMCLYHLIIHILTCLYHLSLTLKLSHYTSWRHFGGEEVELLIILDFGTRQEWEVSITSQLCFSPGKRTPGIHFTGGWVGLIAGLDTEATGKILLTLPEIEPRSPGRPAHSQTLYWLNYPAHIISFCYLIICFLRCSTLNSWSVFFLTVPILVLLCCCLHGQQF
jgi:hypothetical protein